MKRNIKLRLTGLVTLLLTGLFATGCQNFDDKFDDIFGRLDNHEKRLTTLEDQVRSLNAQVAQVMPLVSVLEKSDFITGFSETNDGGYVLSFQKHAPIVIRNGADGKDGSTPAVSVKADTDGNFYWTVNGVWLRDSNGDKIRANGTDGKDAPAPKFGVTADGYWQYSVDGGRVWIRLDTKAQGEQGPQGVPGESLNVTPSSDGKSLSITIGGTTYEVPITPNEPAEDPVVIPEGTPYITATTSLAEGDTIAMRFGVDDAPVVEGLTFLTETSPGDDIRLKQMNGAILKGYVFRLYRVEKNKTFKISGSVTGIAISYGRLVSIDTKQNEDLTWLMCSNNYLSTLDLQNNPALRYLYCNDNQIKSLDLSNNTSLFTLWCYNNQLTTLDVGNNLALDMLWCWGNQLTMLDLRNNTVLKDLNCSNNQIKRIDLGSNKVLATVSCDKNQLKSLDLKNNTALTELYCNNNQLTTLDLRNNTALKYFYCHNNYIAGEGMEAMINSLPDQSWTWFMLMDNEGLEHNRITKVQVETATSKGWTPLDNNFKSITGE